MDEYNEYTVYFDAVIVEAKDKMPPFLSHRLPHDLHPTWSE